MGLFVPSLGVGEGGKIRDLFRDVSSADGLLYKKTILSWLFKGKPFISKVVGSVQVTK